jgi:DNA polymerase-3 subunit gamma/tau
MSGEVLYRKWRPPRFADIVGQNAIVQTLTQAVATGRTSHAYLLCGPRGTGKTSTARVLAKALNCTMRPPGVGDPCGACDACRSVEQGSYIDLIEIDAASNRGIEQMRDIREKVRFSPTQGKFKVYIIDEAHALTSDACNAFLKTLEEPPLHCVFVLATTEAHRLPATIISRCQRFDFHRIAPNDVVDRLAEIATAEGVNVAAEVLRTVSRASGGSLRDATNLLDQLITSFGANVSMEQVQELLGMGGEDRALALVKHLLTNNTTAALELINRVTSEGQDIRPLHRMTVDFLRAALLMKSGVKDSLELSKEAYAELSFASSNTTLEHLLRALRMFGQVSMKFDQPSPLPLELATVELSLEPAEVAMAAVPAVRMAPSSRPTQVAPPPKATSDDSTGTPRDPRPSNAQLRDVLPQPRPSQTQPSISAPVHQPPRFEAPLAPLAVDPSAPVEERLVAQWTAILRSLNRVPKKRFDVAALLRSSSKHVIEGKDLVVFFTATSNSERLQDELDNPQCRMEVEKILEQALGEGFTLRVAADDSQRSMGRSTTDQPGHLVRAAMSLGGQVIQDGVPSPADVPTSAIEVPLASRSSAPVLVEDDSPQTVVKAPMNESSVAEAPVLQANGLVPTPATDELSTHHYLVESSLSLVDESISAVVDPPPEHMATEDHGPLTYEPVFNIVEPASPPTSVDEESLSVAVESALVDGEPSATAIPVPEATELSFESAEAEIGSSATHEPRSLSDPSPVPPEPVSAAAEPGPMLDFGATDESSQEKLPNE